MTVESVAAQLRPLRARIDAQLANRHTWPTKDEELAADLDRYDRRLLKVAAMLGVETPVVRRQEESLLTDDERALLEERLVAAGLDVRADEAIAEP